MAEQEVGKRTGRRRWMQAAALASVAGSGCGRLNSSWRFFSEDEGEILTALCEQIIPGDQDPGAGWAHTASFIDRQMALRYKQHRELYRSGLAALDEASRSRWKRRFVELSGSEQYTLLKTFEERNPVFFSLVVTHTMQGFYGNPRHGGNRDGASWRMLGIPEPPVRGRRKG